MINPKTILLFFSITLIVALILYRDPIKALLVSLITTTLYLLVILINNKYSD